ncbi:MAG: DUF2179 domain-containing protein [Verrucomicrobiae bacterium]|nr:DUF2179 domain-containing protein [Verrucomicrobiae bacterium]
MDALLQGSDSWWYTWVVIPIAIMLARMADQSLGTLRVVFVAKGNKYLAPLVGFFESIIWLLAVSQILKHIDNPVCTIAYGTGFALGNYLGMTLEEKISIGRVIVRVVCTRNAEPLIAALREREFGLTVVDGSGSKGSVKMLFSVIDRSDLNDLVALINRWNPNAFYSVEEVKVAREGVFRPGAGRLAMLGLGLRKMK